MRVNFSMGKIMLLLKLLINEINILPPDFILGIRKQMSFINGILRKVRIQVWSFAILSSSR